MIWSVQIGITASAARFLKGIHARGYHFLGGESAADLHNTDATCIHLEDPFHDRCGLGIRYILLGIVGAFHISVWNGSPGSLSMLKKQRTAR